MAQPHAEHAHAEHRHVEALPEGHAPGEHAHAQHGHHDVHNANYLVVFGALCVFTLLSILADAAKHLGLSYAVMVVIVLAIATSKALCVMLYFMHLKFERNWKYVLLAPTIILAIGIPLALLPDVALHYYIQDVPQLKEIGEEHPHGAAEAAKEDAGASFPTPPAGGH